MVGVGITMLVRKGSSKQPSTIRYHAVDETLSGKEKLALLKQWKNYCAIDWKPLHPNEEYTWLTEGLRPEFKTFLPIGTKEAKAARDTDVLFKMYSNGVHTCRDTWVYNYQRDVLTSNVRRFIAAYNNEVNRWRDHKGEKHVDEFVLYDDKKIKWSRDLKRALSRQRYTHFDNGNVRVALYRPYSRQYLYLDIPLVDVPGKFLRIFPIPKTETKNKVICVAGLGNRQEFGCLASNAIINFDFAFEKTQCFPFYTYDLDGTNRKENITDWALQQFQARCGSHVTKWDIFYYIYALLHHPTYRERYAVNLRRELPRLPLPYSGEKPTGTEALAILAAHGKSLADLHIGYEQVAEYRALKSQRTEGRPVSWRVEKMKLSQDKKSIIVNPTLALHGIPPECFDYRLGNRSALEWVIDQYQVKTDKRSGIVNDPNREDDPEYIVRLVRRVVTVSVETVKIVKEIAKVDLGGGRDGVW
jgi:predicted helicase